VVGEILQAVRDQISTEGRASRRFTRQKGA
jgi:hypothetical protein